MKIDDWTGCYPSNWKGVIVEEAMSHPAKYSSKLIRRIYKHLVDEGWVEAGDRVIDPFGGVALGAFDAMRLGLDWVGVELEERFHKIGNDNIALWGERYGTMPTWGTARLLHGDSRKLGAVISEQSSVVSVTSPQFTDSLSTDLLPKAERRERARELGISNAEHVSPIDMEKIGMRHQSDYGITAGQLGAMRAEGFAAAISSPPFLQSDGGTPEPKPGGVIDRAMYERHAAGNHKAGGYGRSDGQLHHMKDGGFDAAISSPPFAQQVEGGGIAESVKGDSNYPLTNDGLKRTKKAGSSSKGFGYQEQGETEGQLANMSAVEFDAAVSSPPYEETTVTENRQFKSRKNSGRSAAELRNNGGDAYGETDGQLGTESGDDFWLAAREIVEQVYQALTPGGHAVWVVKDYVKNKKVVPFCDQWRKLCEAVGFETLHEHHASFINGKQMKLEGGVHIKESKSFFRRIAEKNGSPRIDFEVVLCMEKRTPPQPSPKGEGA